MNVHLDHLVVGALTLQEGVQYIKKQLGIEIPFGGTHRLMGTHNHLLSLEENIFLEIISINPEIPPPGRPRWFGLDDPIVKTALAQSPRLLTWVVNTDDMTTLLKQASCSFGIPETITRSSLRWDFGLPTDGRLLAGGFLPYIIKWHTKSHPSKKMMKNGCKLVQLELYHPYPNWLSTILKSISADKLVHIHQVQPNEAPYLCATLQTPSGKKRLSSQISLL